MPLSIKQIDSIVSEMIDAELNNTLGSAITPRYPDFTIDEAYRVNANARTFTGWNTTTNTPLQVTVNTDGTVEFAQALASSDNWAISGVVL